MANETTERPRKWRMKAKGTAHALAYEALERFLQSGDWEKRMIENGHTEEYRAFVRAALDDIVQGHFSRADRSGLA